MRLTGRYLRTMTLIVATSVAMVVAGAGTAHAGTSTFHDSFEGDPAATWRVERYGNSDGGFDINAGLARSFRNNAWLTASNNFSAVGRNFTNPQLTISCLASIYIASFGVSQVYLEVIDPRTWIGSWREYSLSSSAYTRVTFPSWPANPQTVFLRVSLGGSARTYGILIDDLRVDCSTSYP